MKHVTSRDGTSIACETVGIGTDVVLIGTLAENAALAEQLATHFRVTSYDQRGYGASGDNQPYAATREIEDLRAILRLADGPAGVYGASAGGALGIEAAAAGLPIGGLAVYEVPYGIKSPAEWQEYREVLRQHLAAGRRGNAFALFMKAAGSTDEQIEAARRSPYWSDCEAIAHTRLYGAEILGDGQVPFARLSQIGCPMLVLTGGGADGNMTGLPQGVFRAAAESIAKATDHAQLAAIDANGHDPDPAVIAAELVPFFDWALARR